MSGACGGYLTLGLAWVPGILITVLDARFPLAQRRLTWLAMALLAGECFLSAWLWSGEPGTLFAGRGLRLDGFSVFIQGLVFLGALCALLLVDGRQGKMRPGSAGLILLSTTGAAMLAMAWDLIGVAAGFIGALVPLWGLSALHANEYRREGALKGMLMGLLATAFVGMGAAFVLARVGTTHFIGIRAFLQTHASIGSDPLMVAALSLLLAGSGCLIAALPLHMWFVDVVESLPVHGALVLSGGMMVAGLAAVGRMLLVGFLPVSESGPGYLSWTSILHGVGIAALVACNALALVQPRLKRMIAYLAAGQGGLVLVTLAAVGKISIINPGLAGKATGSILVFLAVFAVNWIGLFVAVAAVEGTDGEDPGIGRLQGLAGEHPWLAVAVGLALLCMAGMPPTAGFFSRLYLLEAMVDAGWLATAIVAALSLGLVLVMSLGLVAAMVLRPARPGAVVRLSWGVGLVAMLSSTAILLLGILPGGILDLAVRSATAGIFF
jgi:NADH-quinone oxidoreductase subunit N